LSFAGELERFQSNVSGSSPFDLQDIRNAHKLIVELSVSGPQHAEALLEFSKKFAFAAGNSALVVGLAYGRF
jgi:hypothetical protein